MVGIGISAEVKRKAQLTEVGEIPEDWGLFRLDDLSFVTSGKRLPKGESLIQSPTPFPYIRVTDMRIGTVDTSDIRYVPSHLAPRISRYRIFHDDIFISVAGTLGIVGKVPASLNGANLTENADRITNIKCSQPFLMHVLQSELTQTQIDEIRTVGAQPKLALTRLRQFPVPLPPTRGEQDAIAKALSDADELVGSLQNLIAKKRAIKQGAMQHLLTPQSHWVERRLGSTAQLKARIGWQGLTTAEYLDSGDFHLVTGTDFAGGFIDWNDCHFVDGDRYDQDRNIQLREHDVLVTKDGTIGKVAFVDALPKPATLNSGVFVIRPLAGEFRPMFLYFILMSSLFDDFLAKLAAGSTINHLYQKDFVNFSFFVPPTDAEQDEIASTLMEIASELKYLEGKIDKAQRIKKGMMQELLTGRIRLV